LGGFDLGGAPAPPPPSAPANGSALIRFAYRSHDGTASRRQIEPYAVMHTGGRWYLIGHCLSRRALRTLRLDRATDLELCAATFRRPANFDPRAYLQDCMPFIQSDFQIDPQWNVLNGGFLR
jgi:predicted DNA-binding transcriptional regulator YafY